MFTVLSHVETDEAMKMLHRSFLYFMEWITANKAEQGSKEDHIGTRPDSRTLVSVRTGIVLHPDGAQ